MLLYAVDSGCSYYELRALTVMLTSISRHETAGIDWFSGLHSLASVVI